jgi:predicted TIM-barrel fold metal-dependent hydrolase/ketosteroid isomerase-like protein
MRAAPVTFLVLLALQLGSTESPAQSRRLVPVGDYHTHLMSESAAKLLLVPPLPAVELPAEIDHVIRQWERATKAGDPSSLTTLFTADGLLGDATGWVRGSEAIHAAAAGFTLEDLRVRAHGWSVADTIAMVAGSLTDLTSNPVRDVANVTFTLRRGGSGGWLIGIFLRENRSTTTGASAFTADRMIKQLDSAGIRRAVVLSEAYWFGSALMPGVDRSLTIADEHAKVRAENDWVADQVAKHPSRLVAFCSVNPLKSYAVEEIERCAAHPGLDGLKLHLANSEVDLRSAGDVAQLARVFRVANRNRLPIVVHMRPRRQPYGREDVEVMLREVLSQAPDVPIQIAHLAGWGGYDEATDQAAEAFADAVARKDLATRNLYFDITTIVFPGTAIERRQQIAHRIRQLGVKRVVFGSDLSDPRGSARWYWEQVLQLIPLTKGELATIASNVTPYLSATRR